MKDKNLCRICYSRLRQNDKAHDKMVWRDLTMYRREANWFTAWFQGPFDWVLARITNVKEHPYDVSLHYEKGYYLGDEEENIEGQVVGDVLRCVCYDAVQERDRVNGFFEEREFSWSKREKNTYEAIFESDFDWAIARIGDVSAVADGIFDVDITFTMTFPAHCC